MNCRTIDSPDERFEGATMTDPEALRERLIDAAIAHVPFDGWGDKALAAAARDLGIDAALACNAFPGGAIEMIGFHSRLAARRLVVDFARA
jgi:ubiquinone biosynthesis protein COQ9